MRDAFLAGGAKITSAPLKTSAGTAANVVLGN
jgi:hypothetical protein